MHILDECKKHWIEQCPTCERRVSADRLTVINNTKALLSFACGCGWRYIKEVNLDLAVDHIE